MVLAMTNATLVEHKHLIVGNKFGTMLLGAHWQEGSARATSTTGMPVGSMLLVALVASSIEKAEVTLVIKSTVPVLVELRMHTLGAR